MIRIRQWFLVGIAAILIGLLACKGKPPVEETTISTTSEITALATVNGEPIPVSLFKAYVKHVLQKPRGSYETVEQREQILKKFCLDWHLSKKASREKLDQVIRSELLQASLKLLSDYYRELFILPTVRVEPAEVESKLGEFDDEFTLSQITVDNEETAWDIYFLAKGGENFSELARKYSIGLAGPGGGGVGIVPREDPKYFPEQREAIFSLEEGEITEPLSHPFGYIIVRCDKKIPAEILRQKRWNEIENQLFQSKLTQKTNEVVGKLRAQADIWVDEKYFSEGIKDDRYPYLAKVNEQLIYLDDINLSAGMPHKFDVHSAKTNRNLLDDQINKTLFAEEARKQGVDKNPEYVTRLNAFRIRNLASTLIARQAGTFDMVKIKEQEIEENYRNSYKPDIYKLRIILVGERDLAEKIRQSLLDGADFGKLAKKFSIDPSSKKEGELGYFVKGQLREEFNPYLETLGVGETSPVIQTGDNFAILNLTDHQVVEVPPLEAVRDRIARSIRLRKRSQTIEGFVQKEVENLEILINREILKTIDFG